MTPITVAAFSDVDSTASQIAYIATLADGSALPSWLDFDRTTRTFSGTPPYSANTSTLSIQVTGTDQGDLPATTSTFTLSIAKPAAPTAADNSAAATEAGGIANATPGSDPSGNVMGNDTGSGITVTRADKGASLGGTVQTIAAGTSSSTSPTSIAGTYGSLLLGADGSYRYSVDNANADVQALNVNGTLAEVFTYEITDLASQITTAKLTVTLNGSNDAPVATAIAAQTATIGQALSLTPNAVSDVDNSTGVVYTATLSDGRALPSWLSFDPATRAFTGTPALGTQQASFDIKMTGTDPGGLSASSTFVLNLLNPAGPIAVADTASATEAGGVNNATVGIDPTGNVLSGAGADTGGGGTLTVTQVIKGDSPTLDAGALNVVAGSTSASSATQVLGSYGTLLLGADGSYSYLLDNNKAAVQALNTGSTALTEAFTYQVSDALGQSSVTTLTISINGANDAPVATAIAVPVQVISGSPMTPIVVPAFSDVDNTPLTYTATLADGTTAIPGWLIFDSATRTFSGTPPTGPPACRSRSPAVTARCWPASCSPCPSPPPPVFWLPMTSQPLPKAAASTMAQQASTRLAMY